MSANVLVARLDNAGDILLMGPAIRAVATGARRLHLLAGPSGAEAAALLPGVDHIEVYRAPWIDPNPQPVERNEVTGLADRLSQLAFDQALIFTSFHQSALPLALVLRMAGVPVVAAISEDYPGSLLTIRHRVDENIHEVERSLSLAATLGYRLPNGDDAGLRIKRPRIHDANPAGAPGYVVVHPGASVSARAWPEEKSTKLVKALARRDTRVVVTGGPHDSALTARVTADSGALDLGGRLDLASLAEVIAGADVVVVGNTGPAHFAAAVGTPVVSLFAPTVPAAKWRPWHVRHVLLGRQDIACAGCRARTCPVPGHPCLSAVSVGDVLAAIDSLLARAPARGARMSKSPLQEVP